MLTNLGSAKEQAMWTVALEFGLYCSAKYVDVWVQDHNWGELLLDQQKQATQGLNLDNKIPKEAVTMPVELVAEETAPNLPSEVPSLPDAQPCVDEAVRPETSEPKAVATSSGAPPADQPPNEPSPPDPGPLNEPADQSGMDDDPKTQADSPPLAAESLPGKVASPSAEEGIAASVSGPLQLAPEINPSTDEPMLEQNVQPPAASNPAPYQDCNHHPADGNTADGSEQLDPVGAPLQAGSLATLAAPLALDTGAASGIPLEGPLEDTQSMIFEPEAASSQPLG